MFLSRLNQRKAKSIAFYMLSWLALCLFFLFVRYHGTPIPLSWDILFPAMLQFAVLNGLSQGIYEVYVLGDDRFHRPLFEAVVMRSIFNLTMLLCNVAVVFLLWSSQLSGEMLNEHIPAHLAALRESQDMHVFVGYGYVASFLITFARSVIKKFGVRVAINSILGKYQDPKEEERIFMFLDLKSATTLAEELGHFTYSAFLRDYFRLVSNCCVENQGEVYQFAGDGVILTWTMGSCRRHPKPLVCFHDLVICFRNTSRKFEQKYGSSPQFKAALHVGRVIATEVGNFGSEMAYHGDAINTTARIQAMCNLLKKDILVSETFLRKMPHLGGFSAESQGAFQLKGKNRDLEVFAMFWPGSHEMTPTGHINTDM